MSLADYRKLRVNNVKYESLEGLPKHYRFHCTSEWEIIDSSMDTLKIRYVTQIGPSGKELGPLSPEFIKTVSQ